MPHASRQAQHCCGASKVRHAPRLHSSGSCLPFPIRLGSGWQRNSPAEHFIPRD
jgi:hypothetical protein